MKKIIISVIVIAIIAGGFFLWKKKTAATKAAAEAQKKTAVVQRGTIMRNVQATGLVASKLDVEIKCKASGEIVSLPFDISAKVKKGDLLLELDPTDEDRNVKKARVALIQSQARLAQAVSNLNIAGQDLSNSRRVAPIQSQARLEQSASGLSVAQQDLSNARRAAKVNLDTAKIKAEDARTKEDRVKQLYEKKLMSKEEYDTAHTAATQAQADYEQAFLKIDQLKAQEDSIETNRQALKIAKADKESVKIDLGIAGQKLMMSQQALKIARADVESAQLNLSIAEQRLKETKVFAPTDGTITALNAQTGQIISSGINNVGGGTSIMTVSDISQLYILASVDESDIGEIQVGQPVIVTADAYPKQMFRGVVDRIAEKGQSVSNVVTFEVRIEITSRNKTMLKPQMTANVEIVIERKDNVLYVPAGAVFNEDQKQTEEAAAKGKDGKPGAASSKSGGGQTGGGGASSTQGGGASPMGGGGRSGGGGGMGSGQRRMRGGGASGFSGGTPGMGWGGGGRGMRKLKQYVTVVAKDEKTEVREVETGMTDGENIEIISGLKEGELVETREDMVQSKWNGQGGGRGGNRGPRGPMGMMH